MDALQTALVQFNPTVGALKENAQRIAQLARDAAADGAQLIVFPELALCGYPPEDLILRPHFIQDCARQLERMAGELPDNAFCIVGAPIERFNAAVVFHGGKQIGIYRKMLLPNYGVFDEKRVFQEGA
jgi:predicted amidohydrolase